MISHSSQGEKNGLKPNLMNYENLRLRSKEGQRREGGIRSIYPIFSLSTEKKDRLVDNDQCRHSYILPMPSNVSD